MKLRNLSVGVLAAAAVSVPLAMSPAAADTMLYPSLIYRTGAYAPNGIPYADGVNDYIALLNQRDGGINGVTIALEECETGYSTDVGVECYERLKDGGDTGAAVFNPLSTGITYQLIPRAPVDEIPVLSMGYGMTAAADGRVFPWIFNFPTSYWSQASAVIQYILDEEGGDLSGKTIAHVYHNSPYGKEANPTLEILSEQFGYELLLYPVDHPGQEQASTWLQIRRARPDWIFMSGWGVQNQVAVREAAGINYPMDHFVGNWWSSSENDVRPAGDGAIGYKGATFTRPGGDLPLHDEIRELVHGNGLNTGPLEGVGEVLYNRGIINTLFATEAIRIAMAEFGDKALTGAEVRWGLEHLSVDETRLAELGLPGFTQPIQITCADHEGNGPISIQQWDGNQWNIVSDWISPMRDVVRPMIEEAAAAYAAENNITPRDC